jgi:hypothetical protein
MLAPTKPRTAGSRVRAASDEQGVVDADADADHEHGLVGEARHVDQVDGQADQGDAAADAEQGGQQGQAHGQDRPEGQQQDHHGGQEPGALAARGALLGEGVAAQLDPQAGHPDLRDQVAGGPIGLLVPGGFPVAQVELGVGDPRIAPGALAAALGGGGAHHLGVGDAGLQLGEQRRHGLPDGGIVDARREGGCRRPTGGGACLRRWEQGRRRAVPRWGEAPTPVDG